MSQEKALELVKDLIASYRKRKPVLPVAIVCALAWVATVYMIGKSALLLAFPLTLMWIIKQVE